MRFYRIISIVAVAAVLTSFSNISDTLEKVYQDDQEARMSLLKIGELTSDEILYHQGIIAKTDSVNQEIVASILDNGGWPENISEKAHKAIWIVINHADSSYQSKYLDMVKEQVKQGNVSKTNYAILLDKYMKNLGKPQRYGTQVQTSIVIENGKKTDSTYLWPVEDAEHLDELREEMDLPPIRDYLKSVRKSTGLEIIWDKARAAED